MSQENVDTVRAPIEAGMRATWMPSVRARTRPILRKAEYFGAGPSQVRRGHAQVQARREPGKPTLLSYQRPHRRWGPVP